MTYIKCLVCGNHHAHQDEWLGWWGRSNSKIRNDEGVLVERGIYCAPCAPQWVIAKMEE